MKVYKFTYCSAPDVPSPANDQVIYFSEYTPLVVLQPQDLNNNTFQNVLVNGKNFYYLGSLQNLAAYLTANEINI